MAPTIVGTNCLTQAEDAIVALVCNLASFQLFVGCPPGDQLAAKAKIHVHDLPQTLQEDSDTWSDAEHLAMFPLAIIREPLEGEMFTVVQAARDREIRFNLNLRYSLTLEKFAQAGLDDQDQMRDFVNAYGAILDEMVEVANANPGEFAPTGIRQGGSLYRTHYAKREYLGDIIGCTFELERTVE